MKKIRQPNKINEFFSTLYGRLWRVLKEDMKKESQTYKEEREEQKQQQRQERKRK